MKDFFLNGLSSMKKKINGSLQWQHEGTVTGKSLQREDTLSRSELWGWGEGSEEEVLFDRPGLKGNTEQRRLTGSSDYKVSARCWTSLK